MIKILDRYVMRTFLVSLGIVLAAMMGLALLLDIFFNVKAFLKLSAEAQQGGFWDLVRDVGDYYFYKAFDYFQMLAAPSLLVAAAASLVRFNRTRELTGIKAAGVSLYRVMWPMIVIGLLFNALYVANQELLIPRMAVYLAREPDDLQLQKVFTVDFIRDENNNILYAPLYNPETRQMMAEPRGFEGQTVVFWAKVRVFLRDANFEPLGTIEAERAAWDPRQRCWRLTNGLRLPPHKDTQLLQHRPTVREGDPVDVYFTNVGPDEIRRHRVSDFHRFMSYSELKALAGDPMRGNRRQIQVTMHQHVTSPILNLLLLLLGLPFVAGREERNYFVSIGIAVGLVIGVFVVTFASTAFGTTGHIHPLLAAWLPVFLVLPTSIVAMESLRT